MAVEFARQLKDTVDTVSRDGRRDLRFALDMIADIMLEAFDSDPRSVALDHTASDAVAIARAAAQVVDACCIIESSLFGARSAGCFTELALPLTRSKGVLGEFFEQCLRSAGERAPLVYLVWQRDPQRYLYVGRTPDRAGEPPIQRLDARGALLGALQQGSVITVMTPSPAAAIAASDVETALLAVLDRGNALPALNASPDRVRGEFGTAYLAALGRLLCELASKFQAPAERHRKVVG
jgi:hypothetical protein